MLISTDTALYLAQEGIHPPWKVRTKNLDTHPTGKYARATCIRAGTSGERDITAQFDSVGKKVWDGTAQWQVTTISEPSPGVGWQPNHPYAPPDTISSTPKVPVHHKTKTESKRTSPTATGTGIYTNPATYSAISGKTWKKYRNPPTPSQMRRDYLAALSNFWSQNQPSMFGYDVTPYDPASKIGGDRTITNWLGTTKTATPYQLYMAQQTEWLGFAINYMLYPPPTYFFPLGPFNSFRDPFAPWVAPTILAATATAPGNIAVEIKENQPGMDATTLPDDLADYPPLYTAYCSPPVNPGQLTTLRKSTLIGCTQVEFTRDIAGNWFLPSAWVYSGSWSVLVGGTQTTPSPVRNLKAGQQVFISARSTPWAGAPSPLATILVTVT